MPLMVCHTWYDENEERGDDGEADECQAGEKPPTGRAATTARILEAEI